MDKKQEELLKIIEGKTWRPQIDLFKSRVLNNRITRKIPFWLRFLSFQNYLLNKTLPISTTFAMEEFEQLFYEVSLMKYNKSTIKAIKASLKHHRDNLHKLKTLKGEFELGSGFYYLIGDHEISFEGSDCALCIKFGNCSSCPLKIEGYECEVDDSVWQKFRKAKTKPQAIKAEANMVKVLESLLK